MSVARRPASHPLAPRRLLMQLVRGYRFFVSPALGRSCRFEPSCSAYALGALDVHGAAAGSYLALRRVARCGPWCEGGHDPVPANAPRWPGRFSFASAAPAGASSDSSSSSSPHP